MTANVRPSSRCWETDTDKLHFDELVTQREVTQQGSLQRAICLWELLIRAASATRHLEGPRTLNYLLCSTLRQKNMYYKMFQEINKGCFIQNI